MALAVLDLDINALPDALPDTGDRSGALVLLRLDGRPVGQALIPLPAPGGALLRDFLLQEADSAFWEAWLRRTLEIAPYPPADAPSLPKATVAVCTRDRTEDLGRCIAALLAMPDDGQELLIIDNAPASDKTRALVASFARLRYVREDRPGLDVARNRALQEATGEIVAFTDDDAAPDPLWLRSLLRNFSDPLVVVATGATMPLELESEAQINFQSYGGFLRGFKRVMFNAATHDPLLAWHAGAGVNMAMRRTAAQALGGFDDALDAGTATCAGGDSDLFRRVLSAGYSIAYDPEALNWHRHRRSTAELARQMQGYEVAAAAILYKALLSRDLRSLRHYVGWLRRELTALLRSITGRPGALPAALILSRLRGGLSGPFAYHAARRR